jgi:hypothetical protein
MDSYDKKAVKIAGAIANFVVVIGLLGLWLTHTDVWINVGVIIMGCSFIYFSRDLAMYYVVKRNSNYKVARGGCIFVGLVFIVTCIIKLLQNWW